jgi:uncharacterized protein (TIGR03790 family)
LTDSGGFSGFPPYATLAQERPRPHRRHSFRPYGLIAFLVLAALLTVPVGAFALSAWDLVIVYNRNLPDSRAVAAYYAKKRRVPLDHLVGVDVSTSEDMSRKDYDNKLVPPVRAMVEKLLTQGRTPAVLLVYGIPLRVGGVPQTKPEKELMTLAAARVKECQDQVVPLIQKLDQLTGRARPSPRLTYPPVAFLPKAQAAMLRGNAYLTKTPATPANEKARAEITSLLVKLGGTTPEGRALLAGMARSQNRRQALQRRELLGLDQARQDEKLQEELFRGVLLATARKNAAAIRANHGLLGELKFWYAVWKLTGNTQSLAAVDSELTLIVAGPYQKAGWLPNPFHIRYEHLSFIRDLRHKTIMVGRLDGPTPAIARRLVDDALATEQVGLRGVFYIDARGLKGPERPGNYVWFDKHLLHLYYLVSKYSSMKVVLDRKPGLFPPGSCPNAALYCGWYSLRNYVPAFRWNRGSVGYHVASLEASTLKKPGSNVWCKRMLEEGVAATLGPVTEPFLISFPLPDQFFPLLMTGRMTLLEVYFRTVPELSWMQILIGDPLYWPFKNHPALRLDRIRETPSSPKWKSSLGPHAR